MCDKLEQRRQRFIEMARERHGDKYDYSLVELVDDRFTHVTIICPTHGLFKQSHTAHLQRKKNGNGYTGCRKCGNDARPKKTLCIDCGCWNKYGHAEKRCKECKAKHKQQKAQKKEHGRYCQECGKPTWSRDRVYCSPKCRVAKNRIVVSCGHCKVEIVKPACKVRRSDRLFCNPECQRLAMIDFDTRIAKAKGRWKKAHSARRRIRSIGYKWWQVCKRDWFTRREISEWDRRCRNAASGLRNRKKPAAVRTVKAGLTWQQALKESRSRLRQVASRLSKDPWARRIVNQVGHLRRRRSVKDERNQS